MPPYESFDEEMVPYHSIYWCKNWLGPKVNITRAPQMPSEHDGSDIQEELNVKHLYNIDIVPNMTRTTRIKYITYCENPESFPGKRKTVWEVDKASHMNIVRSPVLMREMWQMWHDIHPGAQSKFVTKEKFGAAMTLVKYDIGGNIFRLDAKYCSNHYKNDPL